MTRLPKPMSNRRPSTGYPPSAGRWRTDLRFAPDTPGAERDDYGQVVLGRRLRDALAGLNPTCPSMRWTMPTAS